MPKKAGWSFRESARNVHVLDINLPRVGDEQWVLLMSDVHWDNPLCNRDLLKHHLDLALQRNAPVLDAGDFFCAMQGKYDKRSSKKDIRPEHCKNDYLDALVNTAAEWLAPYKKILTVRGIGNHESGIYKNHETDLIERLAERLRAKGGIARRGGYSGYVRFALTTVGRTSAVKLWYFHGAGGGGPVTRGVIQTNRQAVFVADADIVLTGHTHDAWQVPIQRIRLNHSDRVEQFRQTHIKVGGYKEEFTDGCGGWHVERGGPPKPTGSYWLRFFAPAKSTPKLQTKVAEYDLIEAK
jgi:predicted phosphodiesterase